MKLEGKKDLAARAFEVGKERIVFNKERLGEVKSAITKQDMRDLMASGAISIKEVKGRKAYKNSGRRRRAGSVRKKVGLKKAEYVMYIRGLRSFLSELRKHETISQEEFLQLRKELRARHIKNKSQLKERIAHIKKK